MKWKRWLYLTHRWLGIGMCLLVVMWFASGVVMMYVGFPSLTVAERLAGLPGLQASTIRVTPENLTRSINADDSIKSLRLSSILGRPAYLLETVSGLQKIQFADSGEYLRSISESQALKAAQVYQQFLDIDSTQTATVLDRVDMDQWTVSGSLHKHRPLYKVALHDPASTRLYISSVTGEVVRDTNRNERFWNWLGANLHWIYPMQLRRHVSVWHWVIVVLSLIGLVSIFTGTIAGFMRLRLRKRYRGKDVTPYRGMMKWHHLLGLGCMFFLTTFMFSGLMSMNPWSLFTPNQSYADLQQRIRGTKEPVDQQKQLLRLQDHLQQFPGVKEIHWQWLGGKTYHVAMSAAYDYQTILHNNWHGKEELLGRVRRSVINTMESYHAETRLVEEQKLDRYDLYYYSHHERRKPLPVLRLRFDNTDQSWLYIDVKSGEIIAHQTRLHRIQRWLYNGLHSLDFTFLIYHRPLWDVIVVVLSILGLSFSIISIVIGWRRLVRW